MNLAIKNLNGILENIVSIRYFKFNGSNYLIFTKNEIDESGYQKLYISKINNMVGNAIADEVEWNLVRDTIKVIAKANKEGTALPVEDLAEEQLGGIQIMGQKPFKLTASSVALLAANKKVNANVTSENIMSDPVNPAPVSAAIVEPVISSTPVAPVAPVVESTVVSTPVDMMNNVPEVAQPVMPQQPLAEFTIPTVQQSQVTDAVSDVSLNEPINTPTPVETPIFENYVSPVTPSVVTDKELAVDTNVQNSNIFDFPTVESRATTNPVVEQPSVDYKKLYEEQTLKLNALTTELENYKNIIEQLKNILK